jgi:hypothetical protein
MGINSKSQSEREDVIALESLLALVADLTAKAKNFLGKAGCVDPVAFFIIQEELYGVSLGFTTDEEKAEAKLMIKGFAKSSKAQAVIVITEAWAAMAEDGKLPEGRVSEMPNRRECIVITAASPHHNFITLVEFTRVEGNIVFGAETPFHQGFDCSFVDGIWDKPAKSAFN